MKKIFPLVLIILAVLKLEAQVEESDSSDGETRLEFEDFAYPTFINSEEHASFILNYRLKDNLEVELQSFYDTYLLTNRFRNSLALKQYLTNKIYLFAGVEVEMEFVKSALIPKRPPRVGFISGVGVDMNSDITLEAKGNFGINQTSMGVYGEPFIPMPKVYTVGGKIKF